MKKINTKVILGIFLVLIGILFCVQYLDLGITFNKSILIWGFIALAGVVIMINDRRVNILSSLMMIIGTWNVLAECGFVRGSVFGLIWPLIIVIIGLNLIFSKNMFPKIRTAAQEKDGVLAYNGVFGGVEERLNMKDFKGLNASALFGGVDLDLTDVEIKSKEVILNLSATFGGITIRVPSQYNIVTGESFGFFGGTENKYRKDFDETRNTIYINSTAIFGGVEIK